MKEIELLTKYELSFHVSGSKLMDAKFLIEFLFNNRSCVLRFEDVKSNYGGNPLRLGSLIKEFELCDLIEILKRDSFGRILELRCSNKLWTKDLLSPK